MNDIGNRASALKRSVKEHWEREACGTRYGNETDRKAYFDEISDSTLPLGTIHSRLCRLSECAKNKRILEIGVGAGADFQRWCSHARHATGVDLTEKAIALTTERLELNSVPCDRYSLQTADAEDLPFEDDSFDLVYSWGVLHHTPNTRLAFHEVFRVLKPGGDVKAMIYHVPSWAALMLYTRCGLLHGKFRMTMKEAIFADMESPGTKAYTVDEARALLGEAGFEEIAASVKLAPGDLLTINLVQSTKP